MRPFYVFLCERNATGGFSTEDTLASFLPLLRQVVEAHAAGKVAPLEGLKDLHVEGSRIWFEEAKLAPPRLAEAELQRVAPALTALEIVEETHRTANVNTGEERVVSALVGRREEPISRPVYLPGYVGWEHVLGHHDPLTDIFSLGLILASLACGLDLHEPADLERFARNRRNPFSLAPELHPVLAQAIVRMTELERQRRPNELVRVLRSLEHYRDQTVDLDIELARDTGFATRDLHGKHQVVLSRLQERLFEISRRNRLLHFRPTLQTVNLTQASVPLSFDVRNIRPDQILTWSKSFQRELIGRGPLTLNKYLNFAEALYLPSVLDKIRAEASRDEKEYGFAQLRLVACFLHWTDLKASPPERYDSPLVLLPVVLAKKKGIRDSFQLEAQSHEAEVNPVVRHQFKALYGIDLPETIDLEQTDLDAFFELLSAAIRQSEAAVTLAKIDRPRIDLIHQKAKRRLDQYQRAARVSGRGVSTYLDLDYSYDPANYHPLGIKLFNERVRPAVSRLRVWLEQRPRPRHFAIPPEDTVRRGGDNSSGLGGAGTPHESAASFEQAASLEQAESPPGAQPRVPTQFLPPSPATGFPAPKVVELERELYALRQGGEDENPYAWEFDLCAVTLGNFKYRKMSLVRDYRALVEGRPECAAFDAIFSLSPRPLETEAALAPALEERYHVVPCDPTQAAAVARAQTGGSYIIQGPPGTGKSQTITNLIADYVMRGRRVLFVCEKRAAIDVVYLRLKQQGLSEFCCLIHDSQADKKGFVLDLKQTYEGFLADGDGRKKALRRRNDLLQGIRQELEPLVAYDAAMQSAPAGAGVSLRELVNLAVASDDPLTLSGLLRERLPSHAEWNAARGELNRLQELLRALEPEGVLARLPFRLLSNKLARVDFPQAEIQAGLQATQAALRNLMEALKQTGLPREAWNQPSDAEWLIDYAQQMESLARGRQLDLLDPASPRSSLLGDLSALGRQTQNELDAARLKTKFWRKKLPPEELEIALARARRMEGNWLARLTPGWWRLRRVMLDCYDFAQHVIPPTWPQVLGNLQAEYAAAEEQRKVETRARDQFRFDGSLGDFAAAVERLRKLVERLPTALGEFHRRLVAEEPSSAGQRIEPLLRAGVEQAAMRQGCEKFLEDTRGLPFDELENELRLLAAKSDEIPRFLPCLEPLAALPERVASAIREIPLPWPALEREIADATLQRALHADPALTRFDVGSRDRASARLEQQIDAWQAVNAELARQQVRGAFLEHVKISAATVDKNSGDAEFKKRYSRGRKELEHEFGKSMRYRSIRDLVEGDTALVVRDLKPVWLMSPLSVSDTLPLAEGRFDVVIFDEASQVTLEEAIPCIFRAPQVIVVGDEMQLPPTNFFATKRDEDEDALQLEDEGEMVEYSLDSNSLLNHAGRNLASTMLGWHYRSRSESLISFSNWAFYGGRLLTVPEEQVSAVALPEIRAAEPTDGARHVADLLARPLSFHYMAPGYYEKRRNRTEADYIAELVRGLLAGESRASIGIIAFSEAQQSEIESALERLARQDEAFGQRLEAEYEREEDGQFVGLLVKNLENIQGDERDVVILSVCYGKDRNGRMLMNFGPINVSGGEKRLNVAFSRSKRHMAVVSSILHTEITNEHNEGANCLKNYLRYAAASSVGNATGAEQVLKDLARWRGRADAIVAEEGDAVVESLAAALEERGWIVDRHVGQSLFRCDLAVRAADDVEYQLGILVDTPRYFRQRDLLERDMMKPRLLRNFGWRVAHVLSKDWYVNRQEVLSGLLARLSETRR